MIFPTQDLFRPHKKIRVKVKKKKKKKKKKTRRRKVSVEYRDTLAKRSPLRGKRIMGSKKRGRQAEGGEEGKDDDEEEDSLAIREQEERWKERESVFEAQMRKKEEELKEFGEKLKGLRNLSPTPLWKIVTDKQYKDIFETHILKKLDELDFRVFREVNTKSRDACRRSGRKLRRTFAVHMWSGIL